MAWRVRPSVGGRWVPQHAWAWACALPSTSSPPRCWAGRPPCARVGVRRATPCGSGGASAPAGAWGRWARADAAWQPTSRRPLALPLASACGAGCTPRKREGRRGSPPHGGRRCARDWSTHPTPSTAHAAPCRAGPSPGGASDGSHRPGAPVHLAPVSAPGPARRPVWGWQWQAGASRPRPGCSICQSSRREALRGRQHLPTTKFGGMCACGFPAYYVLEHIMCVMWPSELCGACVAETHSYLAHDC